MTERPAAKSSAERVAAHRARKKAEAIRKEQEAAGTRFITFGVVSSAVTMTGLAMKLTPIEIADPVILGRAVGDWYNKVMLIGWENRKKKHSK